MTKFSRSSYQRHLRVLTFVGIIESNGGEFKFGLGLKKRWKFGPNTRWRSIRLRLRPSLVFRRICRQVCILARYNYPQNISWREWCNGSWIWTLTNGSSRHNLMIDDLWWKMTFNQWQPLMEDDLQWLMTLDRRNSTFDGSNLWWKGPLIKVNFDGRQPICMKVFA